MQDNNPPSLDEQLDDIVIGSGLDTVGMTDNEGLRKEIAKLLSKAYIKIGDGMYSLSPIMIAEGTDAFEQLFQSHHNKLLTASRLDELVMLSKQGVLMQESGFSLEYVALKEIEDRIKELNDE